MGRVASNGQCLSCRREAGRGGNVWMVDVMEDPIVKREPVAGIDSDG
jgi:hypothetical protein